MEAFFSNDILIYTLISLSYFLFIFLTFNHRTFSMLVPLMVVFIAGVFAVAYFGIISGIFIIIFGSLMVIM